MKEKHNQRFKKHDIDLRRWALQKKRGLDMPWFKVSRCWESQFKKKHNVVSQKITKFISVSSLHKTRDIQQEYDVFKNNVKPELLEEWRKQHFQFRSKWL